MTTKYTREDAAARFNATVAIALNGLCAECRQARQLPAAPTERVCYGPAGHYIKPRCERHKRNLLRSKFGDGSIYYCPAKAGVTYCSMKLKATAHGGIEIGLLESGTALPPRSCAR